MTTDTQTRDANDVLMGGGGAPSLKFETVGTIYGGRIVARPTTKQEHVFGKPDQLKYYPSGDPILSVLVDVQTDQRDDADDDGIRRLYIEGQRKKVAVRAAVQEAGAPGLEVGGEIYLIWTGEEENGTANPTKLYTARYVPAAAAALNTSTQPATQPAADPWAAQNGAATQAAAAHVATAPNTPAPAPAAAPPAAAASTEPVLPAGAPTFAQVAAMRITMTDEQIGAAFGPAFVPALYPPR